MLADIEKMMASDTSGDELVHEAKAYVGCAILLLAASQRKQDEAKQKEAKIYYHSDTVAVAPEYSMKTLIQEAINSEEM